MTSICPGGRRYAAPGGQHVRTRFSEVQGPAHGPRRRRLGRAPAPEVHAVLSQESTAARGSPQPMARRPAIGARRSLSGARHIVPGAPAPAGIHLLPVASGAWTVNRLFARHRCRRSARASNGNIDTSVAAGVRTVPRPRAFPVRQHHPWLHGLRPGVRSRSLRHPEPEMGSAQPVGDRGRRAARVSPERQSEPSSSRRKIRGNALPARATSMRL